MIDHIGINRPARQEVDRRVRTAVEAGVKTRDERMIQRTTDILMIDIRRAGGRDEVVQKTIATDNETIVALAEAATAEWVKRGVELELPNGATFEFAVRGTFSIERERWVPDDPNGGLQPAEMASGTVGGVKLDRLRDLIDERVRGQPWSVLGRPEAVTFERYGPTHGLRFAPLAAAGGLSLQTDFDDCFFAVFSAATDADLHDLAKATSHAMLQNGTIVRNSPIGRSASVKTLPPSVDGTSCNSSASDRYDALSR